jgi:methyltransferase (TIGR00027 family)
MIIRKAKGKANMPYRRIDTTTSRTAEMTCISRAMSFLESRPCYRSGDNLAVVLLPNLFRFLVHFSCFRRALTRMVAPKGIYEYVIARTRYIDDVFNQALSEHFSQIVIFGAGFDTRAVRFADKAGNTRIFELDSPLTQRAKIDQYKKRGLRIPPNLTFVPIDFDRESLPAMFEEAGFDHDKRSLFLLEGLLMYLKAESVNATFQTIRAFGGKGSEVVFDYVYGSVLRREDLYYGEKDMIDTVDRVAEGWHFGIEKGKIEEFLGTYDMTLIEERKAEDLEMMYYKGCLKAKTAERPSDGPVLVNGTHCLVRAVMA